MVIFARAWFSESEMNFSLVPGFSFSNSDDNFWASVICELETKAIVTSFSDAPRLPAPEQPAVSVTPATAVQAASLFSPLTAFTIQLHLSLCQQPMGTIDVTDQQSGQLAA